MELLARLANLPGALPGACAQGLIWGIMAIGVYLTYRILDVADLTVDGSFGTGGAVCVMCLLSGQNVWVSLLVAVLAGLATGLVTGLLHTFMGIPAILSGILTQLALYSINLKIMGKANQSINVDKYDLLLSQRHQEFPYPQRNGYNPFPMALGVALNNLPGCAATGTADGQFTSTGYVPPLQGAQFTTPQPGCDGQRIVSPIQNRLIPYRLHQFSHFILLRNMLHLLFKMLLANAVRRIKRNNVIFLGILQHRRNRFEVFLHRCFLDAISTTAGALAQFLAHFL